MPQDLYSAYNSLTIAKKQEVYDFVMFLLAKDENFSSSEKKFTAFGALNRYANPNLIEKEELAWSKSVTENYTVDA